jgi:hypothetical protein
MKRNLYRSFRMKKTASNWNPIATAPAHVELELCVHDGEEYHARRERGLQVQETLRAFSRKPGSVSNGSIR